MLLGLICQQEFEADFIKFLEGFELSEIQSRLIVTYLDSIKAYYVDFDSIEFDDGYFDGLEQQLSDSLPEQLAHKLRTLIYTEGMFRTKFESNQQLSLYKIKCKHNGSRAAILEVSKFFGVVGTLSPLVSPKFDGCSIKVVWDNRFEKIELIQTRGGMDITKNFIDNKSIQESKQFGKHEVFGELIIKKQTFVDKYSSEYKNARNFVGSLTKLKQLDSEVLNDLDFIVFSDGCNPIGNYWTQLLDADLFKYRAHYAAEVPYEIDGIVISDGKKYETRPTKDNYPLNMVAVKFPSEEAMTEITDIEWSVKKTGKITPTLVFKPVELSGSVVQRASGFNYENLVVSGLGIGATVFVTKSGEIIPYVTKVVNRSRDIKMPDIPYRIDGKHLIAEASEESDEYKFIAALRLLQLEGIGEKTAAIIGQYLNYDILEAFNTAHKPAIINVLGGFESSAYKAFRKIYEIKSIELDLLIQLLQLPGVGPKMAQKVAYRLIGMPRRDVGNVSAEVQTLFSPLGEGLAKLNQAMKKLKQFEINVTRPVMVNDDTITFEMTGNPPGMSKSEFATRLKKIAPNSVHTSLTKNTKILFTDDINSNSSKMAKARKYNVKIMSYEEALKNGIN